MDEFRIALISIGVFAIVGILAHGMWTIRKNNKLKEQNESPDSHSKNSHHPKITISSDDPLLSDTESSSTSDHEVMGSSSYQGSDIDPLVGDAPLYSASDLVNEPDLSNKLTEPRRRPSEVSGVEPQHNTFEVVSNASPIDSGIHSETDSEINSSDDQDLGYDDDGIGSVRTVAQANPEQPHQKLSKKEENSDIAPISDDEELPDPPSSLLRKEEIVKHKVSVDDIPMIDTSIEIDESPRRSGALKKEHTRTEVVGGNRMGKKPESIAEKAMKFVGRGQDPKGNGLQAKGSKIAKAKPGKSEHKSIDPKKDQINLDLEATPDIEPSMQDAPISEKLHSEDQQQGNDAQQGNVAQSDNDSQQSNSPQQEVLILNVRVPEGKVIQGAALLPSLLTLGFKFGEHNMFHRHAASNGKGPRLFTLANMFNPGTFDIDNMENFNSTGVSLFMSLPIEADAHQVFNMMHNAARKLADEFGAQVLDGRRSVLTRQSLQQYVEKIREFERRRMIRRS